MRVRFGFVAMSTMLEQASVSKTMTAKMLRAIPDRAAALSRLERTARQNLDNTLRVLRHALALGVRLYRFSSRLVPLWGLQDVDGWDPLDALAPDFGRVGAFVREHQMRVSFHPDHFVQLGSPNAAVRNESLAVLARHERMLEAMQLGEGARLVLHGGGAYGDQTAAMERWEASFGQLPPATAARLVIENDDRTYTAEQTLALCRRLGRPMVLDLHHHRCNGGDQAPLADVVRAALKSWDDSGQVPKLHVSSPRDGRLSRAHADYVRPEDVLELLEIADACAQDIDVMLEAKQKDRAVLRLMEELGGLAHVRACGGAVLDYSP